MKYDRNLKEKLTKEVLYDLYINQKKTMNEIAEHFGVKYSAVHTYITEYKINRKEDPRRLNIDKIYYIGYGLSKKDQKMK